jgi:transposase InsO family protein
VEIINWLDDHSRYLLTTLAYRRVTGQSVIATFLTAAERYGQPQSTLTDNGSVMPLASPAAATASNTCSPASALRRRTAIPAILKPKARLNGSTKP